MEQKMNIAYTYEIVLVDEAARCMEVVYSAEGHQTMRIGARLPFDGESLESVIKAFAPSSLWRELAATVVVPVVGHRGYIDENLPAHQAVLSMTTEEVEARLNADMWAQLEFEKQVASALVKLGVLSENPTLIPVAEL